MKKISALFLAFVLLVSAVPTAFAANTTPNTTTLTTTVPSATYVLNIPADQAVPFGKTTTYIGNVTVTDSKNFAEGKNVDVTVKYAPFAAEEISTTIPYKLYKTSAGSAAVSNGHTGNILPGDKLTFRGRSNGEVEELAGFTASDNASCTMRNLIVQIASKDWGKALAGDYKSTITFTSEVVAE